VSALGPRYYGKVLGGLLGFVLMRHPFGLLVGALLGHAFDAGWLRSPPPRPPHDAALDAAYATLECSPADSDEAIDAAYRRLMSRHHPDRRVDAPAPERARAEERARAINAAYDAIMRARRAAD